MTDPTDAEPTNLSADRTRIEFAMEVPGTPDEVWRAIATGPGISSWYVPHVVEERAGGSAVASFGDGPEMQVPGRVAAWEPPHRIVFDGGVEGEGLAFEWLVEARDGGSCIVRLVNSGFGAGEPWDDEYDGMAEGWKLFFHNLRLHLRHFAGRTATPSQPMAVWAGPRDSAWASLTASLGLDGSTIVGQRVSTAGSDAPLIAGTVESVGDSRIALLLDEPAEGTAFIAAEGVGDAVGVSVWSYLYDDAGAEAAARDRPLWQAWLDARAATA